MTSTPYVFFVTSWNATRPAVICFVLGVKFELPALRVG
jgi:hypothetical protein